MGYRVERREGTKTRRGGRETKVGSANGEKEERKTSEERRGKGRDSRKDYHPFTSST